MATLLHEIWVDPEGLELCVLAGPDGADARALLPGNSRLVHTFKASSHLEAMQYYHQYLGREPYESSFPDIDSRPYPDDWAERQLERA